MKNRIEADRIRFIKLGEKGAWAEASFFSGRILFGAHGINHDDCITKNWDTVSKQLQAVNPKSIKDSLRKVTEFYDEQPTLWITMADGHLWWCLSEGEPVALHDAGLDEPDRYRETVDGWHRENLLGEALLLRKISSSLTKTGSYRGSICKVENENYLKRLLNGDRDPLQIKAKELLEQQETLALDLIRRLHWSEFETLVDLIFARNGWRRTSVLGRSIPDIDFVADQTVTGDVAWVQVKAKSSTTELNEYIDRFHRDGSGSQFFFACHTLSGKLPQYQQSNIHIWTGLDLAKQAVGAGLFGWLTEQI